MKTTLKGILTLFLALVVQATFAQEKTISGTVTDQNNVPLGGVNILVQGTTSGTQSDFDGNYTINASVGKILVFTYIGLKEATAAVGSANVINIQMEEDAQALEEVVVTGMGVSREKKSLGYAAQEISGDQVSTVKVDNVVNSLSGKVSGVQIRASNNFGGSTNFLIRGASSLTGNNQPLFVVDGVPLANTVNNSASQQGGSIGYDYGNAAMDINPDDVASINILKGSAASAIYGSRGANGVVIITTKKGTKGNMKVSLSSSFTYGSLDKKTWIEYQQEGGAGYGKYYGSTGYFEDIDVNNDGTLDLAVPSYEDASFGGPLDGSLVYQWDAFVPESANYKTATPYIFGGGTADFFEDTYQFNNTIAVSGGDKLMSYRLGFTNFDTNGMMPNSNLEKNIVNFNGTLKVSDKFSVGSNVNLVLQKTKGRNSTGYSDNITTSFRQWYNANNNINEQRDIYFDTKKNYSWNATGSTDGDAGALTPLYWDNPYWTRYENFQTDNRNRLYGNIFATYNLTDWLSLTAKAAVDTYAELREERRAVGSIASAFGILRADEGSGYDRRDIDYAEFNYDFMANVNKYINDDISLSGVAGINIRKEEYSTYQQSTSGGLKIPGLYSLSNSVNSVPLPIEGLSNKQVNGIYAQASLGYKNMLYLDLTDRYDISSALPIDNNKYNYYAVSSSLIFDNLVNLPWLNFGKLRAGYAEVGNDLPANNVYDTFAVIDNFGSSSLFSYPGTKANSNLVPERTKEIEVGLETKMFNNKLSLDFSWYKKNTENQLMAVSTTTATGFSRKWVNAGEIQNKGVEVGLNYSPIRTKDFSWDINVNWSRNRNLVVSLYGETENIVLASYQGSITINATKGQPYGVIRGFGFKYDNNGNKIVDANGYYKSVSDQIIGDTNPEWNGGITNSIKYKNLKLNFLVDVQKGGDVYSLDMHYGQGTGLTSNTGGLNELGNPIRNSLADGGGVLNVGVTEDGAVNTTRARGDYYGGAFYWGNSSRNPSAMTVYDASYVKLRELALAYNMPKTLLGDKVSSASLSLVGRNLWIISKNVPYADPESGLGAGNAQGYLSGSYPTYRTVGLSLNIEF
jgi:TonB-linked SusC/RagA family outer membrane protein